MTSNAVQPKLLDIDGFSCELVQPATVAQLENLVQDAAAHGTALYPVGGRTMLNTGLPPTRRGQAVELTQLNDVIDYPARDMTITVESGITIGRLQQILAEENQRLPIDIPLAASATLGGSLAVNMSGPRRFGCGTLRDYVIGISAVNDQGKQIKGGGRVVKNVAGYDLCKLFVGSFGTLGIITQVTLKVVPRPEQHALVVLETPAERLKELLERLHGTGTQPVCLDVLNPKAVETINAAHLLTLPAAAWLVIVGFESSSVAVNWQVQQLIKELQTNYALEAKIGPTAEGLWSALVESPAGGDAQLTFRATVPPSYCADFCQAITNLATSTQIQSHAGNGIVIGHMSADVPKEQAIATTTEFRTWAERAGGTLVVRRCPQAWKRETFAWGTPRDDLRVMRAIKANLDPKNIFNPGRFYGGI